MKEECAEYNITIHAGSDWQMDLGVEDDNGDLVDMTGWFVEAQLRDFAQEYYPMSFEWYADEEGFHLIVPASLSQRLRFSRGVYDVFIRDPQRLGRDKLIRGSADIILEVTR